MFKSILVPVDLGHDSSWRKSLPTAIAMAQAHGAEMHVMTVLPDFGMSMVSVNFPDGFEEKALAEMARSLETFKNTHIPAELKARAHVAHGGIYSEIIRAATSLGCDLIVLGSHRPEMKDYLIGPNAARVVRYATQSVFVVRE